MDGIAPISTNNKCTIKYTDAVTMKVIRWLDSCTDSWLNDSGLPNPMKTIVIANPTTPADMAGIIIKGNDKWRTLIENASKC